MKVLVLTLYICIKIKSTNVIYGNRKPLILGDSMLYGLEESRLRNCKVHMFPHASIEDMHYNLIQLLRKKPTTIILHAGTNNCIKNNSKEIIEKLLNLKDFVLLELPYCKVIFSSLIDRYDDAKAELTVRITNKNLINLEIDIIDNSNINRKHLGKKGLHMTPHGTGRLAINFIQCGENTIAFRFRD